MFPFTADLTVESYLHGVRIDSFLIKHFRNYTSWRMQRLVRAGQVSIEGTTAETADRVFQGQQVRVRLIEPPDNLMPSETRPVEILFEDPWLVVVNKPPDMVVHPCGQYATGSLCNVLQTHLDQQTQLPGLLRAGVVHRLDRLTSGVIVFAKDHLSHRKLSIAFQKGYVTKNYLALVHGTVPDQKGHVALPIGHSPCGSTILMSVAPNAIDAKPSKTLYEVLERFPKFTLVRATPITGRLHQIRVHMAGIGFPIVADEFYSQSKSLTYEEAGVARPVNGAEDSLLLSRQALHAARLTFQHPIRGEQLSFEAKLADDMTNALQALRQT